MVWYRPTAAMYTAVHPGPSGFGRTARNPRVDEPAQARQHGDGEKRGPGAEKLRHTPLYLDRG